MYRLLSPSQLLRKAGKQGLIAIQKQVTKKGKTFTQTFYVKPESVPKDLDKPKQIEVPEREVTHVSGRSGDFELESNRPEGGFYITSIHQKAVRVPVGLIDKVIKLKGHTFVLHRTLQSDEATDSDFWKWNETFRVSELSTGLAVSGSYDTIEETEEAFRLFIESKSEADLSAVISSKSNIADLEDVITDTEGWTVSDLKQRVTSKEVDEVARNIWMNYIQGDYNMGKVNNAVMSSDIEDWLTDVEGVEYNTDLQRVMHDVNDGEVLRHAVKYRLEYYDAFNSLAGIKDVKSELIDAGMDLDDVVSKVEVWAHDQEDDFVDGYDPHMYGVSDKYGDEKWTPADVLKYAIDNDMDLYGAQYKAQQDVEDNSDEEDPFEDIALRDTYGKEWEYRDIKSISAWVSGVVQTTRNKMKMNDESRRRGVDLEKLEGLQGSTTGDQIIDTVERHMSAYKDGKLYRGTKNPAWLDAEVGQTVQLGLASFSKMDTKAHYFSDGVAVLVMDNDDWTEPIVGVDIDNLIEEIREAGYSEGLSRNTSFDAYDDEKEFLVRSPSIEITKIETNVGLRNREGMAQFEVERLIHIKPTEMSMVQFMKALFEDNILAMERTFDFNLHREPEDEWN